MGDKKGPTHEITLGRIRATVWENRTDDTDVWFNVTVSRLFKEEGKWRDSRSFRRDDLPILALAILTAYAWIWKLQTAVKETKKNHR